MDDQFEPVGNYSLQAKGYYALYKQVLIHKSIPREVHPSPLNKGIDLYLNYLKKDSDLMLYIQKQQEVPIKELVPDLIGKFKEYGLGDRQYAEIIQSYRQNL